MADRRLIISFFILLVLVLFIYLIDSDFFAYKDRNDFLRNKNVAEIRINDKKLTDHFFSALECLNDARPISFDNMHFELFGLSSDLSDHIKVIYADEEVLNIYSGFTGDNGRSVFIKFEDDNTIYEVSADLLNIINEKPDPTREYPLFRSIGLTSIIALKINSIQVNLFLTEDSDKNWIEQISGEVLNRHKVQNYLNKILNLRAPLSQDNKIAYENGFTIEIETDNGSLYSMVLLSSSSDFHRISIEDGSDFKIDSEKIDFLYVNIDDFK